MAEAFVKTLKRDYVYVHDRPDAQTIMSQLHQWSEDYNEYHPHKGLKMKSPRQYMTPDYWLNLQTHYDLPLVMTETEPENTLLKL